MQTTATLADVLEQAATTTTIRNFGEARRALRQRCAREGVDHTLIWKGTLVDFQNGCRTLAAALREEAAFGLR